LNHRRSRGGFPAGKEAEQGSLTDPDISATGRYVDFHSRASNLAPGTDSEIFSIYVRDRLLGRTKLVSVAQEGGGGNAGSFAPSHLATGCDVAFESAANDLVPDDNKGNTDVFVRDHTLTLFGLVCR
jgi:TolB protein